MKFLLTHEYTPDIVLTGPQMIDLGRRLHMGAVEVTEHQSIWGENVEVRLSVAHHTDAFPNDDVPRYDDLKHFCIPLDEPDGDPTVSVRGLWVFFGDHFTTADGELRFEV